jgi:hypothetical protein
MRAVMAATAAGVKETRHFRAYRGRDLALPLNRKQA